MSSILAAVSNFRNQQTEMVESCETSQEICSTNETILEINKPEMVESCETSHEICSTSETTFEINKPRDEQFLKQKTPH